GLHRPPALTGVLGVPADLGQVVVGLQRADHQLQQPGPDHGAGLPGLEDLRDVLGDLVGSLQQFPALGVGLHHRVLDAVVHHLGEVARPVLPGVGVAVRSLRLESPEDRLTVLDLLGRTAHHQGVAVLLSPHATGDTAVKEVDTTLGELLGTRPVLGPATVAAVDDDVTRAQQRGQLVQYGVDRLYRHHQPHHPGVSGELGEHVLHRGGVRDLLFLVVPDDGVPAGTEPVTHVAAHLAQTDDSEFHAVHLSSRDD